MRSLFWVVGCAAALLWPLSVQAALLEYEGFDYPAALGSSLNGQNGGTGWGAAWADADNDTRIDSANTSLAYPAGVGFTPSGSRIELTATDSSVQATRALGTSMNLNSSSNVFYASALFQTSAVTGQTSGIDFFDGASNLRWRFGINGAGNFFVGMDPNQASQLATSTTTLTPNTTYLLVSKMSTGTGTNGLDQVFLKVYDASSIVGNEPTLAEWDLTASGGSSVTLISARLNMANGAGQTNYFDELRIGTTWADVVNPVPIPEPGTISLLAAGVLALGYGWRRRAVNAA
jgi:hypothetical protein